MKFEIGELGGELENLQLWQRRLENHSILKCPIKEMIVVTEYLKTAIIWKEYTLVRILREWVDREWTNKKLEGSNSTYD